MDKKSLPGGWWGNLESFQQQEWDPKLAHRPGSPITTELNVHYDTITFNGSFLHETIYRQPPSQEVDAAWDALGVNGQ